MNQILLAQLAHAKEERRRTRKHLMEMLQTYGKDH